VHRITIITAFLGALAYLVWEINDVLTTGTAAAVARCVAAAAFVVALGLYLRNLRARLHAKLRPIEQIGTTTGLSAKAYRTALSRTFAAFSPVP
jgi:hypothetical protein